MTAIELLLPGHLAEKLHFERPLLDRECHSSSRYAPLLFPSERIRVAVENRRC